MSTAVPGVLIWTKGTDPLCLALSPKPSNLCLMHWVQTVWCWSVCMRAFTIWSGTGVQTVFVGGERLEVAVHDAVILCKEGRLVHAPEISELASTSAPGCDVLMADIAGAPAVQQLVWCASHRPTPLLRPLRCCQSRVSDMSPTHAWSLLRGRHQHVQRLYPQADAHHRRTIRRRPRHLLHRYVRRPGLRDAPSSGGLGSTYRSSCGCPASTSTAPFTPRRRHSARTSPPSWSLTTSRRLWTRPSRA